MTAWRAHAMAHGTVHDMVHGAPARYDADKRYLLGGTWWRGLGETHHKTPYSLFRSNPPAGDVCSSGDDAGHQGPDLAALLLVTVRHVAVCAASPYTCCRCRCRLPFPLKQLVWRRSAGTCGVHCCTAAAPAV